MEQLLVRSWWTLFSGSSRSFPVVSRLFLSPPGWWPGPRGDPGDSVAVKDVSDVAAITLGVGTARGKPLMCTVTTWTAECRPRTNVSVKR